MTFEVQGAAHITPDGAVQVVLVANNPTTKSIRLGTMMSEIYDVTVSSDSVSMYGETMGHLAAPFHLTLPAEHSVEFTRDYPTEQPDVHIDYTVDLLTPDVTEEVTVEATVYSREDNIDSQTIEFSFTPSELEQCPESEIINDLKEYPLTENEMVMG